MEYDKKLLQDVKKLMIARYPRFASQIASANLEYKTDLRYHTAATDGKNIYFDPNYLASLSDDDKLFIVAHELMHVKFEHMYRLTNKDGQMRDPNLWNIATDAIINANLEQDGFKIKEGYVNMPEALNYSAEEFYDKLLKEKQEREQQKSGNKQSGGGQNSQSQNQENSPSKNDKNGQNQDDQNKQTNEGQNGQNKEIQTNEGQNRQDQEKQTNEGQNGQNKEKQNGQQNSQSNGQNGNQSQQNEENDDKESVGNYWKGHNGDSQGNTSQSGNSQNNNSNQIGQSEESRRSKSSGSQSYQGNQSGNNEQFADDHSLWEKAFKESKKQRNKQMSKSEQNGQSSQVAENSKLDPNAQIPEFDESQFNERAEFQENRKERRERAKRNMESLREQELKKSQSGNIELGDVGQAKPILDWKLLLRREVEKTETIWSQRRSIAENNYAYRLEENDVEDEAETEVMIDVSGSVSLEMVKAFLRQLKPILKASKLKVGCFNEKFWGMVEIKSNRDIDNFKIPSQARGNSAWTEDWDLAVRSFSKKREVNKIVFTDGEPCPGTMPKEDLKGINVIWLVYSNRDFHPCCGKVININKRDLKKIMGDEFVEEDFDFTI